MAEFCDVMKQWRRFCKSHRHCGECEFDGKGICGDVHLSDVPANDIELRIMAWAAENPEPVYPTWHDFLYEKGVLRDRMVFGMPDMIATDVATDKVNDPIPADIAQLLGLKPVPIVHGDCGAASEGEARKGG